MVNTTEPTRVHGHLKWCGQCQCFHHDGLCPCAAQRTADEKHICALEAKIRELRGLLADYVTKDEQS